MSSTLKRRMDRLAQPRDKNLCPRAGTTQSKKLFLTWTLHPAVQHASYFLGDSVKEVAFYNINRGTKVELINLAIANDFALIPVVTMITIRSQQPVWGIDLKAKVKNGKGVKVIDVFTALEKESNRRVVTGYGVTTRAERCGDHRHYEGLRTLIRSGLGLKTDLYLGS
ncbi:hypothetical protein C8J57DRAFT_1459250 [Mycena rebaudengoi]|nr:hypothetical protein C8J57DRAFT_1459250 [Mycena rebaudengoi]